MSGMFLFGIVKKKYNVGWWDCNRLSYRSILDLYGRKGQAAMFQVEVGMLNAFSLPFLYS